MGIAIMMALAMSSPLVFQGLWLQRWFRVCWWIGLVLMVVALANTIHPFVPSVQKPIAAVPTLPTTDEFFASTQNDIEAKREALATCKTSSLQTWGTSISTTDGLENYFDACMQARSYHHVNRPECFAGYASLPANPAYNYVFGYFDVDQRGIFDCYAK